MFIVKSGVAIFDCKAAGCPVGSLAQSHKRCCLGPLNVASSVEGCNPTVVWLTRGNFDADRGKNAQQTDDFQIASLIKDRQQGVLTELSNAEFNKQMQRARLAEIKEAVDSNFGLAAEDIALLGGMFRNSSKSAEVFIVAGTLVP